MIGGSFSASATTKLGVYSRLYSNGVIDYPFNLSPNNAKQAIPTMHMDQHFVVVGEGDLKVWPVPLWEGESSGLFPYGEGSKTNLNDLFLTEREGSHL
jgi:hypothetical protein